MIAMLVPLLFGSAPPPADVAYIEFADAYTKRAGLGPLLARAGAGGARDLAAAFRDDPSCARQARLLIIGSFATNDPAIRRAFVEPRGALERFVEDGGVILVLSQADQDVRSEDWTAPSVIVTRTDRDFRSVRILRPDHPLLSGLGEARLRAWRDPPISWESLDLTFGAEILAAQDEDGRAPWLAEAAWGKGRAIFCAWPLDKLAEGAGEEERELAATFLRNAIAYADLVARGEAPAPKPAPGPIVSGTVFVDRDADGARDPDEPGLAGVGVSDGFAVAVTDAEGRYRIEGLPEAVPFVFATIPSGYRKTHRFYRPIEPGRSDGYDFGLIPLPEAERGREGSIVHVADIHLGIDGIEKIRDALTAGLAEIARLPDPPALVVGAGDLTDKSLPEEFRGLLEAMERAPIPFLPVIGNHDCAPGQGGRDAWRRAMGPDWYSFDVGSWHLVCLDSAVRCRAQDVWLERDVELLGRGKRKIAFQHHPPARRELERFARLGIEAVGSGHWHTTRIHEDGGVLSIDTATFLMGGIDLSPAGFRILRLDAPRLSTEYRFTGAPAPRPAAPFPEGPDPPRVRLGEPWPQLLGGPERTGRSSARIRPPLRRAWERSLGAPIQYAQPLVAEGKVFAVPTDFDGTEKSGVVALDAQSGDVRWCFRTRGQTWNAAAYADGIVVVVDQPGGVYALEAATGRLLWARELVAPEDSDRRWFKSAPAIARGIVYAGNNARIAAIRLADGEILWQRSYAGDWICGYASPAVSGGIVIAAGLWTRPPLGLDIETGEILWEAAGSGGGTFSIQAPPCIAGDRAIFARVDGRLSAHGLRDGKAIWDVPLPENWSPTAPTAPGGRVVAGSGTGVVSAHDPATGEKLWQYGTGESPFRIVSYKLENLGLASAPVLAGDLLYVGGADGRLRALAPETGREVWSHDLGSPLLAPPSPSGNALFVAAMDGRLHALVGEGEPAAGPAELAISTLFTAQNVRDLLSTEEGLAEAVRWCRRLSISRVFIESFRDGFTADRDALARACDRFRAEGFAVSGCVTTTQVGKPSTGWRIIPCYTDEATRRRHAEIFAYAASLFDEIMIDDFLFTDCTCEACAEAKGGRSWSAYRSDLMLDLSRKETLAAARAANPNARVIIKYPQWYDLFHERGYDVVRQSQAFDAIWVGTETRDPEDARWGRKAQYEAYFIMRWLGGLGGRKTGGGWFDPYGTSPATYVEQARQTVLGGAREMLLFCYGSLRERRNERDPEALRPEIPTLREIARTLRGLDPRGVLAVKPPSSPPAEGEAYLFDFIGMLGIPLVPAHALPAETASLLVTSHLRADPGWTGFVERHLAAGRPILATKAVLAELRGRGEGTVIPLSWEGDPRSLMDLSAESLSKIRDPLLAPLGYSFEAPGRIALYIFADRSGDRVWAIENFADAPAKVALARSAGEFPACDRLVLPPGAEPELRLAGGRIEGIIPARSLVLWREAELGDR